MPSVCAIVVVLAVALVAAACSESGTPLQSAIAAPAASGPAKDPCQLLTDAEVREIFPEATAGTLDRKLETHGVLSCFWDYPEGRLTAGLSELSEAFSIPIDTEIQGWSDSKVRIDKIEGVGDQARAAVERADGTPAEHAILIVRRGDRQAVLVSPDLARRDRAVALEALKELGRSLAPRL